MRNIRWLLSSLLMISGSVAHAAAFQIQEQSAALLGNTFGGSAVLGQDASTVFYNPAGLVNLNDQVSFSSTVISARTKMSTDFSRDFGVDIQGKNDNPSALLPVPGFYLSHRLSPKAVLGLGLTPPFGLKTEYSNQSYVRYLATKSELVVVDFTPSIGYQLNERWALGAGIDLMNVEATLNAKVDAGGEGLLVEDAAQKNTAHGRAFSFHGGMIYRPLPNLQAGLVYHAPIYIDVRGQSKSSVPGTPRPLQDVKTRSKLPESLTLSTRYEWQPGWSFLTDLAWTRWDRMQELRINFENGVSAINPLHFESTWRLAFAVNHQYNPSWLLRAGFSLEESPVRNGERTPRVPDSDRLWVGFGARKQVGKHLKLDVGYAHIFFRKAFIDDSGSLSALTSEPLFPEMRYKGNFRSQADLVGLQLSWDYV